MRPAPPLTVQVVPSRAWRLVCGLLGAAAGGSVVTWAVAHLEGPPVVMASAAALAAAWGFRLGLLGAGSAAPARVSWDGARWEVDGTPGELSVMLDLDRWLVLRLVPQNRGAARWLAVSRARGTGDWRALRTALYSRPPEATPDLPHGRPPQRATD